MVHFIDAENVSIAHLAYENTLLKQLNRPADNAIADLGGRTYLITDPNPPITYGYLYKLLAELAHPSKAPKFPTVPIGIMYLLSNLVECYELIWTQ